MGKRWKQWLTLFWGAPKSLQMVIAAMKLKDTPWKKSYDQPRQHIEKQRHYFVNKGPSSQGYGFSSGHVWMWELDYKESWALKNWCFWTVVLEKTLESPCKEISPEYSLEGLMLKLKLQYFSPWCEEPTQLKRPWCWERLKAGWVGDNRGWDGWMASPTRWTWVWASSRSCDGHGSQACCSPWGDKESNTTDWTYWEDSLLDVETTFVTVFTHQLVLCCAQDRNVTNICTMNRPWEENWCFNKRKAIIEDKHLLAWRPLFEYSVSLAI